MQIKMKTWNFALLLALILAMTLSLAPAKSFAFAGEHAFARADRLEFGAQAAFANGHPIIARSRLRRARRAERRGFRRAFWANCGLFGRFCY